MSVVLLAVAVHNGATENAGVEIVTPKGIGGNRERNEYGKPKFPFSNMFVKVS